MPVHNAAMIDPIMIAQPESLWRLANKLSAESLLAVDTESNSLYAYREQVCLIQFSTNEQDYLIDPLVLDDLSPLAQLFANPGIEKIFHAAEYDLICLKRDFGFTVNNIFDTMMAARVLGRNAVGLATILEVEFNVHVDKRCQRADWGQRPLPPHLIKYASQDTHHLIALRHLLKAELETRNLYSMASDDFRRMSRLINARDPEANEEPCWRLPGARDLQPQQYAVLQQLCLYRDQRARTMNRPLFKVINNQTLLAIAAACPTNLEDLKSIPGMSRGQVERHGQYILLAIERGLNNDPPRMQQTQRPDERYLARLDALKQWRKMTAHTLEVESDVIMPRDLLVKIAEKNPTGRKELEEILVEVPWRLEHFGDQILSTLTPNS